MFVFYILNEKTVLQEEVSNKLRIIYLPCYSISCDLLCLYVCSWRSFFLSGFGAVDNGFDLRANVRQIDTIHLNPLPAFIISF